MADEANTGTPWLDDELDAVVADYFEMRAADLAGTPHVKSRHRAALMERIGRSHGSIEFKHQNISAVLEQLGLPWIPGYKPKPHYQNAILDAIDRYLTRHQHVLQMVRDSSPVIERPEEVFVEPPPLTLPNAPTPLRLEQLVHKFDPVERDQRNRALGKAGEAFVVDLERRRLTVQDRADLARHVRWVAAEDGDGAGYDVLSFDRAGKELLIEVKTTNGSARTPFFLTNNERDVAEERAANWRLYRVHRFGKEPRVFVLAPPLEASLRLRTHTWCASFT